MRCVICGRPIRRAAAHMPAVKLPMPHGGGPVGPVCAVAAGLMRPPEKAAPMFERRPARRKRGSIAQSVDDDRQMDLIEQLEATT